MIAEGAAGGARHPNRTTWVALGQAWPARTRRLARLAAITANPPDTARAAASTARTGRASWAVRWGREPVSGRASGRASRWGWRSALGPAAAGGRRPRRRRQLNRALHTILLVRLRVDPDTRTYLARRTAQGKTRRDAKRCLRRVIARQLFRLLERYDQPGVEILWAA